jgi:hypothetical protein
MGVLLALGGIVEPVVLAGGDDDRTPPIIAS